MSTPWKGKWKAMKFILPLAVKAIITLAHKIVRRDVEV